MSRVLVVDDEPRYREHISRALARDGHEVCTAGNGRDAIATGSRFRPEVLIADWMLKDHLHGLHVSEALRAVVPGLETILITGFPSTDLRDDARSFKVSEFLEKPFEMARLRDAVRTISSSVPTTLDRSPIAVFSVDRNGAIRYPNERARQLLGQTRTGELPGDLWTLIDFRDSAEIRTATQRWVVVEPRGAVGSRWHLRAREHPDGQGWLIVVVPDDQQHHKDHPVVQMLLDLKPSATVLWPFQGRTLIVDDDQWVRHVVAEQIECGGGICHAADTVVTALRTCERDSGIDVIVLDYDLPGESPQAFLGQCREILPRARVVGTSGTDRSAEFARIGVSLFLLKPWTVSDLINLLLDRIGNCTTCGVSLPLRRVRENERPQKWVCQACGAQYKAVLAEELAEDAGGTVRRLHDEPAARDREEEKRE